MHIAHRATHRLILEPPGRTAGGVGGSYARATSPFGLTWSPGELHTTQCTACVHPHHHHHTHVRVRLYVVTARKGYLWCCRGAGRGYTAKRYLACCTTNAPLEGEIFDRQQLVIVLRSMITSAELPHNFPSLTLRVITIGIHNVQHKNDQANKQSCKQT